jgi:hypothetical protein
MLGQPVTVAPDVQIIRAIIFIPGANRDVTFAERVSAALDLPESDVLAKMNRQWSE